MTFLPSIQTSHMHEFHYLNVFLNLAALRSVDFNTQNSAACILAGEFC